MTANKFWKQSELDYLRDNYASKTNTELANHLARTIDSISHKARDLKLSKPRHSGHWNEQDLEYLKNNYANTPNPDLAKALKRNTHSICNKASELGLHKVVHEGRSRRKRYTRQWHPIGTERLNTSGYLRRKVTDTGNFNKDWRSVHVLIWEAENGPVPSGYTLAFKDGNKQNITLENLELITPAQTMKRNSINQYPEDVRETIKMVNELKRKIKGKENGK